MNENEIVEVVVPDVTCPKCGGHTFREAGIKDKTYICCSKIDGKICDNVQYYCKTCNEIKDESRFGKHGDVWECKDCGSVCWPCTDRMRAIEKYKSLMSSVSSFMNSLRR